MENVPAHLGGATMAVCHGLARRLAREAFPALGCSAGALFLRVAVMVTRPSLCQSIVLTCCKTLLAGWYPMVKARIGGRCGFVLGGYFQKVGPSQLEPEPCAYDDSGHPASTRRGSLPVGRRLQRFVSPWIPKGSEGPPLSALIHRCAGSQVRSPAINCS